MSRICDKTHFSVLLKRLNRLNVTPSETAGTVRRKPFMKIWWFRSGMLFLQLESQGLFACYTEKVYFTSFAVTNGVVIGKHFELHMLHHLYHIL